MNEQFQSLFDNVCRCFGHTPTSAYPGGGDRALGTSPSAAPKNTRNNKKNNNNSNNFDQQPIIKQVNSQISSVSGKKRTNQLELGDNQYDELFDKAKQQQQRSSTSSSSSKQQPSYGQPPRPEENNTFKNNSNSNASDHETAQAVAQAKIAANPPRYRTKRKRSSQTREEIFRHKNKQQQQHNNSKSGCGGGSSSRSNNNNGKASSSFTPQTDFSRLLNPSLALCFATPIRTEEFDNTDETDVRSLDNSDTATLNTNGEDTITSTLYFDSKYAHIQESGPPMQLFNEFKLGQAKDEIRTIMATDSHSSVRMIKIMQQNEQHNRQQQHVVGKGKIHNRNDELKEQGRRPNISNKDWGRSSPNRVPLNNNNQRTATAATSSSRKKDKVHNIHTPDEEMEDVCPDVKAVSSSTDSSRLSNTATKHSSL